MSSNIPLARHYLQLALADGDMDAVAHGYCTQALRLMTRAHAVRRAPSTPVRVTPSIRLAVRALRDTDLTMHEIADRVGLPNIGRVSEIMRRKR